MSQTVQGCSTREREILGIIMHALFNPVYSPGYSDLEIRQGTMFKNIERCTGDVSTKKQTLPTMLLVFVNRLALRRKYGRPSV